MSQDFCAEKSIGRYLQVDETNRLFCVNGQVYAYADLRGFTWIEDGNCLISGQRGGALARASAGRPSRMSCKSMQILLTFEDPAQEQAVIRLVTYRLRRNNILYRSAVSFGEQCVEEFRRILGIPEDTQEEAGTAQSAADEIRRFYQLMEDGIITREEFEEKKKQLLGLS